MKVETHMQSVTIEEIPNAENLVSVTVNLQDMNVELLYKGYTYPYRAEVTPRYDGELDPPRPDTSRYIGQQVEEVSTEPRVVPDYPKRAVRDSPQA